VRVALDRRNMPGSFGQQRARQPAGTGADFDDVEPVERTGGACDAAGQVQVEEKMLAQPALRRDAVARDDVTQRRQRCAIEGRSLAQL
jgi:hypothetical protein